jgi:hypothetical protein
MLGPRLADAPDPGPGNGPRDAISTRFILREPVDSDSVTPTVGRA